MEITGTIIQALPEVAGTSAKGNAWRKREYILETAETYPKKVMFAFLGERIEQYPLNVGDRVKISFDVASREFNGRWYTDVTAWKAEPAPGVNPSGVPAPAEPAPQMPAPATPPRPTQESLPF